MEPYRPRLHFSPLHGWMNDPNGLIKVDGAYHLFFQHDPDSITHGPMHWGQSILDRMRLQRVQVRCPLSAISQLRQTADLGRVGDRQVSTPYLPFSGLVIDPESGHRLKKHVTSIVERCFPLFLPQRKLSIGEVRF
ncbi:hypothetical protein [Devosia indica]|uniref:hypothetical protein n=1 Tax=Devosia indica TaxID=2079253 RepID=UPI002481DBF2|nr:hypothetical protein [Devosia indica]